MFKIRYDLFTPNGYIVLWSYEGYIWVLLELTYSGNPHTYGTLYDGDTWKTSIADIRWLKFEKTIRNFLNNFPKQIWITECIWNEVSICFSSDSKQVLRPSPSVSDIRPANNNPGPFALLLPRCLKFRDTSHATRKLPRTHAFIHARSAMRQLCTFTP